MPYAWKIEYNSVDISDKVSGFAVTASLESYCREMTLDIADPSFYTGLDFTQVPESPEIEIFTMIDAAWISQGTFFIERPALDTSTHADLVQGVWGRSATAKLTEPFAPRASKLWDTKTTFFSICDEMCELAGLTWDSAYSDIDDYLVYPHTYAAESMYPIDVITELATLAGALVTTDRSGHVCVKRIDYAPALADETLTDSVIRDISETPEMPEFANRVRITPTGALTGYSLDLTIPDTCLPADGATRTKLFAQVRDPDGNPVDGLAVAWSENASGASLIEEVSNTQEIYIPREEQRASDYYTIQADFPPSVVVGVWAYADLARTENLALAGYSISGNTITLNEKLVFCDQSLVISYISAGMAINYLQAGEVSEDVTVTVDIAGEAASETVYVDNPCQCPPSLTLSAHPSSIHIEERSALLAYMEESGPVTTGRTLYMSEGSAVKRGVLAWNVARFGVASVANQKGVAVNEISGITQTELTMFPASISSVYRTDVNGNATGSNLYASHSGKVVNLNAHLANGTELVANYRVQGAVLNHFTGESLGSAKINAFIRTNREAVTEAEVLVSVIDETERVDDFPEGWGYSSYSVGWKPSDGDDDFDPYEEPETTPLCIPDNVGSNPSDRALRGRFKDPLEDGCSCEEMCQNEFDIHDTNQGNDGGSYRTISELAEASSGHPPGSPEHGEDYGPLKGQSLADCKEECEGCENIPPLEWPENNPDTISRDSRVAVWISGGRGPYQWSVTGAGFSLVEDVTLGHINTLIADETACGPASITVTDECDNQVTGEVRCTSGSWCLINECLKPVTSGSHHGSATEIRGKYQYWARWTYTKPEGNCDVLCPDGTCDSPLTRQPAANPEYSSYCCCTGSRKWEWKCFC